MSEMGREDAIGTPTTALPWSYDPELGRVYSVPTNLAVAAIHLRDNPACLDAWPADAAFIVRAVNAHGALVASLRDALTACADESERRGREDARHEYPMEPVIKTIGRALALARGEG